MKKDDIQFHSDGSGRRAFPALNVKVHQFTNPEKAVGRFHCSTKQAQQAISFAFDQHQAHFWGLAQATATEIFGPGVTTQAQGRSTGWLVVEGLPPFASWDAIMVAKWARFAVAIKAQIRDLCSDATVLDSIEANQWWKEYAEEYNFVDKQDGTATCLADMKADAIAAGFGPVVRA